MAVLYMRNASGRNSSFIVDVVMGNIPRSTERMSSFFSFYFYYCMTGCSCHANTAFVAKDR